MRKVTSFGYSLAWIFALAIWSIAYAGEAGNRSVILSTTTSTQDSGLLDVLVPLFEKQTGYAVKTISVGTGQALALGAKGDADVVLVHAPSLEKKYAADGTLLNRRLVMYNDFIIIGPKDDPAKIRSAKSAMAALQAIDQRKSEFCIARRQLRHPHAGKGAMEGRGYRPQRSMVHRSGTGHGRHSRHRE